MQTHHLKQLLVGVSLCLAFALGVALQSFVPFARVTAAQGIVVTGSTTPADAAAPAGTAARLTYQGRLTNSSGAPINSTVNIVFRLYDSAGTLLWTSATRSITPVNGLFTVFLGDGADPNLDSDLLAAATIGVTVVGDAEMTPRQALNTVVGHSENGAGVVGSSNSARGVYGTSYTAPGVYGYSIASDGVRGFSPTGNGVYGATTASNQAGIVAYNSVVAGAALQIDRGGIKVTNADVGTSTPVFIQQVVTGMGGNVCPLKSYATVVNNPLINGKPKAILIVTPNYGTLSGGAAPAVGVYGVFYDDTNFCGFGTDKWVIYIINSAPPALTNGSRINVLVVTP